MAQVWKPQDFTWEDLYLKTQKPLDPVVDYSKMSDEELLKEVKKLPEFKNLVMPNSWYSKFELPLKECMNMKEFIAESPWRKRHMHFYTGKLEDIKAQPGGNRPILEAPEAPQVVLIENHFSDAEGPKETPAEQDAPTNRIVF